MSDGIGMVTNLDWSENLEGSLEPCMCSFGNGILIYGPDNCLRVCIFTYYNYYIDLFTNNFLNVTIYVSC